MSINDISEKIKRFIDSPAGKDFFIFAVILFVAFGSFGLGRISKISEKKHPIILEDNSVKNQTASIREGIKPIQILSDSINQPSQNKEQLFVASKRGKKYYFPWCAGAQNIKEENKIWFKSHEEAKASGFEKSISCPGL